MAVPKKKTSKSKQRTRSASKHVSFDQLVACDKCREPRRPHHLCTACGYYNDKKIIVTRAEKRQAKKQAEENS